MKQEQLIYLLKRYADKSITAEEMLSLRTLLNEVQEETLIEAISDQWEAESQAQEYNHSKPAGVHQQVEAILLADKSSVDTGKVRQLRLQKKNQWYWAAAAIVVFASVILLKWGPASHTVITDPHLSAQHDIAPGKEGAILVLADGSEIVLDSAGKGNLALQGNSQVIKLENGDLTYVTSGNKNNTEEVFNTMRTPAGNQYKLVLEDGTKVWLNAASSITYPAVFTGKERRVKIKGEAYFEVAKNISKPFLIDVEGRFDIQVLGTAFNVNAYPDEKSLNTTLLHGSVKIKATADAGNNAIFLKPGEQAQVAANGNIRIEKNIDREKVMAWKNGFFNFNDADLQEVMREVARWYDIEVVYEGTPPAIEFVGKISRNLTLSQLLNGLKGTGFNFKVEGRKLIISK
jgi:transmembrane sensor